jgi:plasmid maintenance system antidote protein VapI
MFETIQHIKGIHPGFFLAYELKKREIAKSRFAISINEYPQTLVSITKGKRRMNAELALKIEENLHLEEGFLMILQVYHDIEKIKSQNTTAEKPDLSKFRPALFWDTTFDKIDWGKHKKAVIERVNERGNEEEKAEIRRFYQI